MRIEAPANFRNVAELFPRFASQDPRLGSFGEEAVDVDLRSCSFVRPSAVLWCAVYLLLAKRRGSACRLFVPENRGVCVYLKSLGLFQTLQQNGIEVDDRGIAERLDPQIILPLTRFQTETQVEELANRALDTLGELGLGSANLHPLVSEAFAELAQNAVQHAESPIGAYGFIQFYEFETGRRFVCGVADGGIGIRRSLERNPALKDRVPYDWVAVELAVRERVSGTGDPRRGIGLYGVSEDMRRAGRQLIIHSGIGSLQLSEEMESAARRVTLFPGTLAYASIPT
ncbi:MAG: hypothetical protein Q8O40_03570 [Chloroflexota bacterium]|nr:hypothetical protein [Chloroflexota bacterium]